MVRQAQISFPSLDDLTPLDDLKVPVIAKPGSLTKPTLVSNSETSVTSDSSALPLPPISLKKFVWWFRIGLGLFLLISSLLLKLN